VHAIKFVLKHMRSEHCFTKTATSHVFSFAAKAGFYRLLGSNSYVHHSHSPWSCCLHESSAVPNSTNHSNPYD